MADADTPGRAIGLRAEDREVAGEIHARACDARLVQDGGRAVDRVLLAEAAEIELHSASGDDVAGIRLDAPPVDQREQRLDRRIASGTWDIETPRAAQDSRRGIEGAAALPVTRIGEIEEPAGLGVDLHRLAARVRVDARDDAVVTVARILRLDPRDFGDRLLRRGPRGCVVFGVNLDFVLRRHGAEREAVQRHGLAQNARLTPAMP
jgi:hypothetical protein